MQLLNGLTSWFHSDASRVPLFFLVGIVGLGGCQVTSEPDYSELGLVEISGQLLLEGEPLSNAEIRLEDPTGSYSFGRTNEQGKYKMMFDSYKSGVMPGEKRVVIVSFNGDEGSLGSEDEPTPTAASNSKIPNAYGTKSKIKVNVEKSNSKLVFDLRRDGTTTGPRE